MKLTIKEFRDKLEIISIDAEDSGFLFVAAVEYGGNGHTVHADRSVINTYGLAEMIKFEVSREALARDRLNPDSRIVKMLTPASDDVNKSAAQGGKKCFM